MDGIEGTPLAPIRLSIGDDPNPYVLIGVEEGAVDVTQAVERILIDVQPGGVYATLTLRADLDFDFPVNRVSATGADPLADLTAEELNRVAAGASLSETLGDALLRHLQARWSPRA